MSTSKLIGGILLIVGTSIGGGMLALPVATASAGMIHSIFFLVCCWLVMTAGALLILEVNLTLPRGSNMISMAKKNLGLPGEIIAWISYLFLLYTLIAAYISGGSDVFQNLLKKAAITLPSAITSILFTTIFSFIIYSGIRIVDYVNRVFMFSKLGIYLLLIIIISPHIHVNQLHEGSVWKITGSLMILITSFGFASIVPSLREYFHDDVKSLRLVILWGSLIPLICYILWEAVIMGVVEHHRLVTLMDSNHATSGLMDALNTAIQSPWLASFFGIFTSICMVTAFLGVSLGLFDFLADGFKLKRVGHQGKIILLLTFLPPLGLVLLKPGIYLQALSYAGIACVVLLLLLPTAMAWQARKEQHLILPGGRGTLSLLGLIGLGLLVVASIY